MFRHLLVAFVALVGLTAFAPAPRPRALRASDEKALLDRLQGTWELVNIRRGGGAGVAGQPNVRVKIEGQRWNFFYGAANAPAGVAGRTSVTYELTLDASQSPAWVDLQRAEVGRLGAAAGKRPYISGIVKVEGDTVQFCYVSALRGDASRPCSFSKLENGQLLMTLKRIKP